MLDRFRQFLAPPLFPEDEEKTRAARVLNSVLLNFILVLIMVGTIALPFIFAKKIASSVILFALLLLMIASRSLMKAGRIRAASILFVSGLMVVFTVFILLAGGVNGIGSVYYVATPVLTALLLGRRASITVAGISLLAGLGMVLNEEVIRFNLHYFPLKATQAWVHLTLGLILVVTSLNYTFHTLRNRLVLARREIEERKKVEEALKESERRHRDLYENAPNAYFSVGATEGSILKCNQAALRLLGYERERVEKMNVFDLYADSPEGLGEAREIFKRFKEGGLIRDRELLMKRKDGHPIWVSLSVEPLRDLNGDITESRSIAIDISERKRAERALRESEYLYRTLAENSLTGIYMIRKGEYVFANDMYSKITGYPWEDLISIDPVNLIVPEERGRIIALFEQRLAGKEVPSEYETRMIRKDGTEQDVQVRATLVLFEEKPTVLGNIIDITERKRSEQERKRLEERLQRAEKMEAIGTLAGGVAHDLNNILTGLVSYPELLLMQVPGSSPLRDPLLTIKQSGQKAAAVVQDLLTLARRGVALSETIRLNDLISGYLKTPEFIKLKADFPNVTFRTELEEPLLSINGSTIHLGKTLLNLVSNGAEAIPAIGEVTIKTRNHYLDEPVRGYDDVQEGDYVVLTVSDNGKGISREDLGKIFEPFYTKKVMGRSGTGLGLAVVWGTVKDHSGYIDVKSEVGRGSMFDLYFPVTTQDVTQEQRPVSIEDYQGRGESILVVDDVKEQREIAIALLGRLGYQVAAVSSGEEAVEGLKTRQVDLVILDMIMRPGIDGLETYRRILSIRPGQKALIVSGFSETDRAKKAQELGAGEYIRKPYLLERLGLAVRRELDRQ